MQPRDHFVNDDLGTLVSNLIVTSSEELDDCYRHLLAAGDSSGAHDALQQLEARLRSVGSSYRLLGLTEAYDLPTAAANLVAARNAERAPLTDEEAHAVVAAVDAVRRGLSRYSVTGEKPRAEHLFLLERLEELRWAVPAHPASGSRS